MFSEISSTKLIIMTKSHKILVSLYKQNLSEDGFVIGVPGGVVEKGEDKVERLKNHLLEQIDYVPNSPLINLGEFFQLRASHTFYLEKVEKEFVVKKTDKADYFWVTKYDLLKLSKKYNAALEPGLMEFRIVSGRF